ncbi:sugar (pentulose or hexulose) kinase [Bradyrhizobium sp. LM6.10]
MNKLLLTTAMVAMISTGAMAQSTVVTTTGTGHAAAVQIEPEFRTKIRTYVTEHKVRPVQTREKIIVGQPVPREVELEAVPADWGPSLTKYRYIYSGERVMLVDPSSRTVVQEID